MPSRTKDAIRRRLTDLGLLRTRLKPALPIVVLLVSIGVGVVATWRGPIAHTRSDANGLSGTFVGLLAGLIATAAIYAGVAKRKARTVTLLVAVIGCGAAIAGLLNIPLDAYRYAFGVAIGAIADNVLSVFAVG